MTGRHRVTTVTRLLTVLLLAHGVSSAVGASGDWPSFKGQAASGVASGPAPTTWNIAKATNIAWKTAIVGLGHSSPVLWGDRVFVTTAVPAGKADYVVGLKDGPDLLTPAADNQVYSWRVLALDKRSGAKIWEKTLHEGQPRLARHTKNTFATPTPATDGRHLVVYFGSEGLYCLNLDGELHWKQDLGPLKTGFHYDPTVQWGVGSSPVLYKNLAILQVDTDRDGYLAAFNLETGARVWTTPRQDGQSWSTPTIYQGPPHDAVIANAPKHVRGYDPATGRELWRYRWDLDIVLSTPTVAHGLIFTASGKGADQPILAIRPTAKGDITLSGAAQESEAVAWSSMRGGPIITSPLVYNDYLYALVDIGILRCFLARTGEFQYQERLPDSFLSSPVAADGKVYLVAESGNVYVLSAGSSYQLLSMNEMSEPIVATPAISDGLLFVRTLSHLYAIGEVRPPDPALRARR